MVYGVTRIALPSSDWASNDWAGVDQPGCNWGDSLRSYPTSQDPSAKEVVAPSFVAGPENRLAVPALQRLLADGSARCDSSGGDPSNPTAEDLAAAATLFNPLVLLGPTGTGKSHLARGIARRWQAILSQPGSNRAGSSKQGSGPSRAEYLTAYLTAADFARQLQAAREDGELDDFRQRLSRLRLLVLEDLHRLSPRLFVQRELRDTLDVLSEAGAMVVVTSQQPPAAMAGLEAGLRDRLACGLTVRLQAPGVEARLELLQQAAAARGLQLDGERLRQLATQVEGTAPQLFRAIVEAEQELTKSDSPTGANSPTIAETRSPLRFKQILAVVARYYSLTQAALCSSARRKSLVHGRSVAIYLARTLTDLTYADIGNSLGGRDHSTIMHAARTLKKQLATDATTQQDIEKLKRILTAV